MKLAQLAEKGGFRYAWVPDDSPTPPFGETFVSLAAIALATTRLHVGSSLCNPYTRNPALIASAALALHDLSRSKAIIGLGVGSAYLLEKIGLPNWVSPYATLKNAVTVIRRLLEGETVTFESGVFKLNAVKLSKSKIRLPIYVGARGPRLLDLAGRIADGVLLATRANEQLPPVIQLVKKGASAAGRSLKSIDMTNSLVISTDEDRPKARRAARLTCAYIIAWASSEAVEAVGIKSRDRARVAEALAKGREEEAAAAVTDLMIDKYTISGTPGDCVERCMDQIEMGIDHLIFCEPFGPNPEKAVNLIGKKIIPGLVAS